MTTTNKPTIGFWMIAVIAFIWNLMGAYMYIIQKYKTEAFESQYTSMQLDMIYSMPAWATAAFAIAVFGGVLGSVTLLMRRKIATSIYFLSLIGIICTYDIQHFYKCCYRGLWSWSNCYANYGFSYRSFLIYLQ